MQLLQGDCLELMKALPDNSIDLTVTSPPYDNLRTYNGNISQWSFDKFKQIAKELFRVTKDSGVVVWVVGDATINGSETGTSFKQALWFKECGFNLHDTMIYQKSAFPPRDPKCNRYWQAFEYMLIFSKGKPKQCNYIKVPCKHAGEIAVPYQYEASGKKRVDRIQKNKGHRINNMKIKSNVWEYSPAHIKGHPAPFPLQLAHDHIISWSNEEDTVLDCFMGSGTTGVACVNTGRKFIGMELDEHYFEIAKQRIDEAIKQKNTTE